MWLLLLMPLSLAGHPTKRATDKDAGADLFRDHCWACHGRRALGDGPLAATTEPPAPALAGRIEGERREELARLISEGRGDMPGYAAIFTLPDADRILTWLEGLDPVTGLGPAGRKAKAEDEEEHEADEELEAGEGAQEDEAEEGSDARPRTRLERPVVQ